MEKRKETANSGQMQRGVMCATCKYSRPHAGNLKDIVGCTSVDTKEIPPEYTGKKAWTGYFRTTGGGLVLGTMVEKIAKCKIYAAST